VPCRRRGDAIVVVVVAVDEEDLRVKMFQRIVEVRQGRCAQQAPISFFPIFLSFNRYRELPLVWPR
jgi:hypothetical protein